MISTACAAVTHVVGDAVAELRGEQGQQRAHPLAAGGEQVAGADVGEAVVEGDLLRACPASTALEALVDARGEHRLVLAGREQALGEAELRA